LFEDEGVEHVGADGAFRAELLAGDSAAGLVATGVVAMDVAAVAVAAQFVGVEARVACAAADKSSQQPRLVVQVARAPFGVVPADSLGCLEDGVVDYRRAVDLDPFFAGTAPLGCSTTPAAVRRGVGGDGLGLVEVDPTDIGLGLVQFVV
jgi:hypothetical protein